MSTDKIKFSSAFWTANLAEMLERTAYYAIFVAITLYLSNILGFNDIEASLISGGFSALMYLLPIFSGAYADKIGYRKSMILAFTLMPIGYLFLGLLPYLFEGLGLIKYADAPEGPAALVANLVTETQYYGLRESNLRWLIIPVMLILVVGGSFIRSIIRASVARETTTENRARGYSIFYMLVNIGAFSGKSIIDPLRGWIGERAYIYVNFVSVILCLLALVMVILMYHSVNTAGEGKSIREVCQGLVKGLTNWRLLCLIFIATGFWMCQQQLYASMPKYVIRMAGESAKPGWIANVNPLVVVLMVNLVTKWMSKYSALTSMVVGMILVPVAALVMSTGNLLGSEPILGMHPITLMLVLGIMLQGLCECFITPRYLEYFSLQAPKGEEGMYLGFSQLDSFFSSIIGFGLSGVLLSKYCPDPTLFATHEEWLAASANAHYIWYYFAGIGLLAAVALVIFEIVTKRIDKKKAAGIVTE